MLSKKMETVLNQHLNSEFNSSYLYLSMASWFEMQGLSGFANWMHVQTREELMHAQKFYTYILEKGAKVSLSSIEKPAASWNSSLHVFQEGLAHEQEVTRRINDIMTLAIKETDHSTTNFLNWFIEEQVEEEASIRKVIDELTLVGNEGQALFLINRELGQRQLVTNSA